MGREGGRKGDEYILLTMVLFTRWRPLSLEPKARRGAGDRGMGEGRRRGKETVITWQHRPADVGLSPQNVSL